ncbi:MAG: outer membrane lipoprotein carrier protein LolA [Acidobacteriia bacterium]|nr:outer membrane lipoprotein carrier protein LolA [Terriglobia bacterium]
MLRAVLISLSISTFASAAGGPLEEALAKMDQAAGTLKDLSADLTRTHHVALINEDTVDKGVIYIKRPKSHELLMHVVIRMPDPKEFAYDARRAEVYYPKSQTEEIYDVGKYKNLADQLLLLGFGTTSKELAEGYTIALGGAEVLNGQKMARLELTPKSDELHLKRVDLWISDQTGLPMQQKLFWPGPNGGDYDIATYTNMKVNPNLPESTFKLTLPKGTKKQFPQK